MNTVFKEIKNVLEGVTSEEVLELLGLQRRNRGAGQALAAIGLVGIGVVIGGVGALMLSPKNGAEIRQLIGQSFEQLKNRAREMMPGQTSESGRVS